MWRNLLTLTAPSGRIHSPWCPGRWRHQSPGFRKLGWSLGWLATGSLSHVDTTGFDFLLLFNRYFLWSSTSIREGPYMRLQQGTKPTNAWNPSHPAGAPAASPRSRRHTSNPAHPAWAKKNLEIPLTRHFPHYHRVKTPKCQPAHL